MNNVTKGALIGSLSAVAALAAVGAASHSMSHSLIKIALSRDLHMTPSIKTKKLFSGCRDLERIESLCVENARVLENGNCQGVEIRGRGGSRLAGHLHISKSPKRVIIAMHGWRTTWARDFGGVSSFWHNNGCNVLYAEQRGHNNSEGDYISFGIMERFDCLDWARFVNRQMGCGELPVYLCGVSMGAATVLMSAGLDLPENVAGIIADCGFTSPHDIFKHVVNKNLHCPYSGLTVRDIDRLCKKRMNVSLGSYSTVEAMKHCRVPVLFVHGTDDRFVPIEMTYNNYLACAAPKRLFVVPGADHGMSYYTDRSGYESEMLRFFDDNDGRQAVLSENV